MSASAPSANSRVRVPKAREGAVLWPEEEAFAARLAIGSLSRYFPASLAPGLRAPTLFCVVGALAGFAAQHAMRQQGRDDDEIFSVRGPNGEQFWFGDRLNALLMPDRLDSTSAFSILAGQALRLGAPRDDLPDCLELFERVAKSIGTKDFGALRLPAALQPGMTARRAVETYWPTVQTAFARAPVAQTSAMRRLGPLCWPRALAVLASQYMQEHMRATPPAGAVRIFMEAAVPMSKIDPVTLRFARQTTH